MRPQFLPVTHLIQLGNAHAVAVGSGMFRFDIHRNFTQIEVGADAGGGRHAGRFQNIEDDLFGQFAGAHAVGLKIAGRIHEDFVDGIDMNVLGGDIFEINAVNFGAHIDVAGHPRRSNQIVERRFGMPLQFVGIVRAARQPPSGCLAPPFFVHRLHPAHHLEQPRSPGKAVRL